MSLLFADIYDGIRAIRITKGACEKDILNFVQEKVGGCMNVGNVLKTIRALKQLCDDGVLIKKGNRYIFAQNNDNDEEEKDENLKKEEEENECPEENGSDNEEEEDDDNDEDECEGEQDDDDDDEEYDDDDEEEDDDDDNDDDDDDDEECEKDVQESLPSGGKPSQPVSDNRSDKYDPCNGDKKNNSSNANKEKDTTVKAAECEKKDPCGRNSAKEKVVINQNGGDARDRGGEAIAFCVRDFIDSLSGPNNDECRREKPDRIRPKDHLNGTAIGVTLQAKKRAYRRFQRRDSHEICRSRSPIEKSQLQLHGCLKWNQFDDNGLSCDFEPAEVDMDIVNDVEITKKSSELQQSADGFLPPPPLPSPKTSGKVKSCCSNHENKKISNCVKKEISREELRESLGLRQAQNGIQQKQSTECSECCQMPWCPLEEREKHEETFERTLSSDNEEGIDKRKLSLCSLCKKKKRDS